VDTGKMKEHWFSAEDGLGTVRALQNNLAASGIGDHERIASELQEFATVLELAKSNGVR